MRTPTVINSHKFVTLEPFENLLLLRSNCAGKDYNLTYKLDKGTFIFYILYFFIIHCQSVYLTGAI